MYRFKKDKERINNIKDRVFKEWTNIYWQFIIKNEDKYINWEWIS